MFTASSGFGACLWMRTSVAYLHRLEARIGVDRKLMGKRVRESVA